MTEPTQPPVHHVPQPVRLQRQPKSPLNLHRFTAQWCAAVTHHPSSSEGPLEKKRAKANRNYCSVSFEQWRDGQNNVQNQIKSYTSAPRHSRYCSSFPDLKGKWLLWKIHTPMLAVLMAMDVFYFSIIPGLPMLAIVQYLSIISWPAGGLLIFLEHMRHNFSWFNEIHVLYSVFNMWSTSVKLTAWLCQINKPREAAAPWAYAVLHAHAHSSNRLQRRGR